jgi:molecular chaperone DnaK (HSP70)
MPLIQQTKTLILEAISKSHFHPTAIREILLIGGSTRMPWVT